MNQKWIRCNDTNVCKTNCFCWCLVAISTMRFDGKSKEKIYEKTIKETSVVELVDGVFGFPCSYFTRNYTPDLELKSIEKRYNRTAYNSWIRQENNKHSPRPDEYLEEKILIEAYHVLPTDY